MHWIIAFLQPLGLAILAMLGIAVWLWRRQQRREGAVLGIAGLLFLSTVIMPLGERLLATLERPWYRTEWDTLPAADAVLCLGGGISPSQGEIAGVDVAQASDRILASVELLRRCKAPVLVISGGNSPPGAALESSSTKAWIQRWQLTPAEIVELPPCTNTRDEAVKMQALATQRGWKKILLVTSAGHMRRSEATFRKVGLDVSPVACAYSTQVAQPHQEFHWVHPPSADELHHFAQWFHETVGWWAYRWRGWL
jgi:uncharacterized SAM-binding protein YcdF (DUF218 family)